MKNKIIIEIDDIIIEKNSIQAIHISIYKEFHEIVCALAKRKDGSFAFQAMNLHKSGNINFGYKSIILNNFPQCYTDNHYYNRKIIRWIIDHIDEIIKKLK